MHFSNNSKLRLMKDKLFLLRYVSLFAVVCFLFSCREIKRKLVYDPCDCPIQISPEIEKEISDSSVSASDYGVNVSTDFALSKKVKELIDANLELKLYADFNSSQYIKTFQKLVDTYPEITRYDIFKREFYCGDILTYCHDDRLSVGQIDSIKRLRLSLIEKTIEKYYLEKLNGGPQKAVLEEKEDVRGVAGSDLVSKPNFYIVSSSFSSEYMSEIETYLGKCNDRLRKRGECGRCESVILEIGYDTRKKSNSEHLFIVENARVEISDEKTKTQEVLTFNVPGAGTISALDKIVKREAVRQLKSGKSILCTDI